MFRLFRIAILLGLATTVSGCDVTGVAAPAGQAAHTGGNLQFIGEPGYNAP